MEKIIRRRYLVNKEFQFRYMRLVAIPLLLLLASLYYLIYYCVFNQILIPEAVSVTLLPAMRKVNFVLIFAAPIALFIILKAALIYSNRIIGPIQRLEKELDKAIAGDYSARLVAREGDELKPFLDKVNTLLEEWGRSRRGHP